jgi:hypothetical protein
MWVFLPATKAYRINPALNAAWWKESRPSSRTSYAARLRDPARPRAVCVRCLRVLPLAVLLAAPGRRLLAFFVAVFFAFLLVLFFFALLVVLALLVPLLLVPLLALEVLFFAAVVLRPAVEARTLLRLARLLPRVRALAVSRPISLLKLLCSPRAVWSCTSNANFISSNFSNQSSHSILCREPEPEYPGKSSRIIPVSPPPPVPRTHAGAASRSSAHSRISSWSVRTRLDADLAIRPPCLPG